MMPGICCQTPWVLKHHILSIIASQMMFSTAWSSIQKIGWAIQTSSLSTLRNIFCNGVWIPIPYFSDWEKIHGGRACYHPIRTLIIEGIKTVWRLSYLTNFDCELLSGNVCLPRHSLMCFIFNCTNGISTWQPNNISWVQSVVDKDLKTEDLDCFNRNKNGNVRKAYYWTYMQRKMVDRKGARAIQGEEKWLLLLEWI